MTPCVDINEDMPSRATRLRWFGLFGLGGVLLGAFLFIGVVGTINDKPETRQQALSIAAQPNPYPAARQYPFFDERDEQQTQPVRVWKFDRQLTMVRSQQQHMRVITNAAAINNNGKVMLCGGNCAPELVLIVQRRLQQGTIDSALAGRILARIGLL